ncbi:MAG: hypothetical protein R6W83_05165, partial [Cryobacterium sp.]
ERAGALEQRRLVAEEERQAEMAWRAGRDEHRARGLGCLRAALGDGHFAADRGSALQVPLG